MADAPNYNRRLLWKVSGESNVWPNYPTQPTPDKKSRLFVLETEDVTKHEFSCSAFNASGSKLACSDQRGNLYEFDFKTFKCEIVSRCGVKAHCLCYAPKHDDIAVALNNSAVHIYECGTFKLLSTMKTPHQSSITRLQFAEIEQSDASEPKLVLMSCSSDMIVLWHINSNCQQLQSLSHQHAIIFGLISRQYQSIVTCFSNDRVSFWDWADYTEKFEIYYNNKQALKENIGHKRLKLICGDIDDDKGLLAVGGRGRFLYVWSIAQRLLLKCIVLPATVKHVMQIRFLPQHTASIILVLGDDGQIVAVSHETLCIQFYIQRSAAFIKSFSVSGNNKKIACVLSDGCVEILSVASLLKTYMNTSSSHCTTATHSSVLQPLKLSSLNLAMITKSMIIKSSAAQSVACCMSEKAVIAVNKLSVSKLRDYLDTNQRFPDKYRPLIWRYLLHLPNLSTMFAHYEEQGMNQVWQHKLDDINEKRCKQRLLKLLSLLSSWCALCEHLSFLPTFIYPFTKLYHKDDQECFECVLSVVCKYGSEWFVQFPDAPVQILSAWPLILRHFDEKLFNHFAHHRIAIEQNLWSLLQNGFCTLFNETDWLHVWDHILLNAPLFMHLLPIAVIMSNKSTFYAMHTKKEIEAFFAHQQRLYVKRVLDTAYHIQANIPQSLLPVFRPMFIVADDDVDGDKTVLQYPIFNRYPPESLDLAKQQLQRKTMQHNNEQENEKLLQALLVESKAIAQKQTQFTHQQRILDYTHKQRVSTLQAEQKQLAMDRKKQSEKLTKTRLDCIGNIHKATQQLLQEQDALKKVMVSDLDNQIHHHRKISEIDSERVQNEAAIKQLEADSRKKLLETQLQQNVQAQTLRLQRLKQHFDQQQTLKQQLLEQKLSTQDHATNFEFVEQKKLFSKMQQLQDTHESEQILKQKLKLQSIIDENRHQEIESENKLAHLMNEQLNVTESMLKKQNNLQHIVQTQEDMEIDAMLSEYHKFKQSLQKHQEQLLQEHKNALLQKLKQQQQKFSKLSQKQRVKQFEAAIKEQQNEMQHSTDNTSEQLQQTIDLVQQQIEQLHDNELELEKRHTEMLEQNAFKRVANDAKTQIMDQEKQKYAVMRESMLSQMQQKEAKLRQQHEETMKQLIKQREGQLIVIGKDAKHNVYKEEMSRLHKEYDEKQRQLHALQSSLLQTQQTLLGHSIESDE